MTDGSRLKGRIQLLSASGNGRRACPYVEFLGGSMAAISTREIVKTFGEIPAVNGISLEVPNGEFMVLLGPSGCGKTTFLRVICGLERQTSGDLLIGGSIVNDIPPRARGVAMMFQSYGLYPHYTVRKNMAFPLRTHRVPSADINRKVKWESA